MNYKKDVDEQKKEVRQKIRDDFIKMRMTMPAGPRPEPRQIGELSQQQAEQAAKVHVPKIPLKGKKMLKKPSDLEAVSEDD